MVCIYCGSPTNVVNSRHQKRSNTTWRRRKCSSCSATVSTTETTDLESSVLFKDSASGIKPFMRDRLFLSIYESCGHRTTALSDAIGITATIVTSCLNDPDEVGIIHRSDLVRTAHETLKRFDIVASTYYAAYHPATIHKT